MGACGPDLSTLRKQQSGYKDLVTWTYHFSFFFVAVNTSLREASPRQPYKKQYKGEGERDAKERGGRTTSSKVLHRLRRCPMTGPSGGFLVIKPPYTSLAGYGARYFWEKIYFILFMNNFNFGISR